MSTAEDPTSPEFGLLFVCQDPPDAARLTDRWQQILDAAPIAEAVGFTSLHVPEHHLREDGYLPQPLVACAALAARTRTAMVGPTLMVGPLRHPVHVVEQAATVDVISGGRLVLGLGIGNFSPEYELFGIPMRQQARRFDELLDVLRAAWTQEAVTHRGSTATLLGASLRPLPVQRPHPPLWVGAMSQPGAIRAGERGDALLLDPLHTITALEPLVETYREAALRAGRRARVILMRWGWIEDGPGHAEQVWWPHVRPAIWTYVQDIPRFREGIDPRVAMVSSPEELDLRAVARERFLVGDGPTLIDRARDWAERLGAERIVVKLQGETGPWGEQLTDAIERFGTRVIAHM